MGGFLVGENKTSTINSYNILYKNLNTMSSNEKIQYYESLQKAETSPTQMKYVLKNILEDNNINTDIKNNMFAFYLNHIQYYMTTYSNFISLYESIIMNNRQTIDYTNINASEAINDNVLKTIIKEIYNSDMRIAMPPPYSDGSPYVLIDYENLEKEFGYIYNDATKQYISFKQIAQNGGLSNDDGSYNKSKLENYLVLASEFLRKYETYPLVSDIIYSYILASKMYADIYDVYEDFYPDSNSISTYKQFIEKYPNEPITPILNEIVKIYESGDPVTYEQTVSWNSQLDALLS